MSHNFATTDNSRDRISITQRFSKHRDIWFYPKLLVQATERLSKTRRAFIKHQHDSFAAGEFSDALQEPIFRAQISHYFHNDHADGMLIDDRFQHSEIVIRKRMDCSG